MSVNIKLWIGLYIVNIRNYIHPPEWAFIARLLPSSHLFIFVVKHDCHFTPYVLTKYLMQAAACIERVITETAKFPYIAPAFVQRDYLFFLHIHAAIEVIKWANIERRVFRPNNYAYAIQLWVIQPLQKWIISLKPVLIESCFHQKMI